MQFEYLTYTAAAQRLEGCIIHKSGFLETSSPKSIKEFWLQVYLPIDSEGEVKVFKIIFDSKKEMTACLSGFGSN